MTNNILYLYQEWQLFSNCLDNLSNKLILLDYIQYIHTHSYQNLYKYIDEQINLNKIDTIFIYFTNCDSSLDIKQLYKIKRTYNLKFAFIFNDSHNSFEYIDRYYAQLADLIILPNIPIIYDFYKTLDMPVYMVEKYLNNKKIIYNNIFSSSLINLVSADIQISDKVDFYADIFNIFEILSNKQTLIPNKLLLDNKFLYTQDLFKIFWILKEYIKNNNTKELLKILKYYKYSFYIFKLFRYLKHNQDDLNIIQIFNQLFYKKYTIK